MLPGVETFSAARFSCTFFLALIKVGKTRSLGLRSFSSNVLGRVAYLATFFSRLFVFFAAIDDHDGHE